MLFARDGIKNLRLVWHARLVTRYRKYVVLVKVLQNPHRVWIPLKVENPPRIAKNDLGEVHEMLRPAYQLVPRQRLHALVIAQDAKLDIPIRARNYLALRTPWFVGPDATIFDDAIIFWFSG